MTLKLKRLAPLQAGKMLAALYGLLSLIVVPFMLVGMGLAGAAARSSGGAAPVPVMLGLGIGFVVLLPVAYAGSGFLAGVVGAAVYNVLARWLGGFELEFAEPVPPLVA